MSTAVKRACDACHRRKVKCDGINPCRNCSSAQLTCTYNAIPQKKGPKGSRAKVISELRETQRATSLSAKVQSRLNGINSPPCAPTLAPNAGLLAPELVKETIDFFFANMYPMMPILNRQRLEQQALYMDQSLDTYCLVSAMSAFMLLQPGFVMPGGDPLFEHPGAGITSCHLLMEEAIRVRKGYEYTESPTLNGLCTSYFLFGCYYALEMHDKAWYHLREATTLAHMIGMTQEDKYLQFDTIESSRRRRLYWQLFVTERAYALKYGRPVSLPASINPPTLGDDPTDPLAHQLNGHILLANLFRPFDDTFMLLWNKTRSECTPAYLGALQKQLSETHLPYGADSDLRANQSWLKTVTWNLSMQNGMSPGSDDMYQYPIDMSRDLASLTSHFSTQSTEFLGVPLVAKLLDISSNLADVLSMQPSSGDPFSITPQQQLQSLLQVVSVLRSGEHHFLPLLLSKVHDALPRLANPLLQRVPDNICNIDIFDGFGNAGMAQPPVMTDFKTEQHFKPEPYTPAPVPRVDEIANDSGSSNGAPTATDMNSPFAMASSPAVMSPAGVEYPHMAEYNSIPDIMGSMGQSQASSLGQAGHLNQQSMQHQQQQHTGYQQGLQQSHTMHNQIQNSMHSQVNQAIGQQQGLTGLNQQQPAAGHTQGYNHVNHGMAQNLMNNILHRQPPQRSNSFILQQPQQQQTPQIPRTVGDFHALQRANSDNVGMSTLGMNSMGSEMDFSTMR
ncbi:hypothetical protein JX265_009876 [Neoarthrinium moseri]|uniref:Zn(2)-C6 fungal-type domain-containing protein n=1 Tax=Neoarthrinium moseri TaxID=1658444 RepID=A0A9Q0AM52_9PEZI|nr:hypothetical protein JX265_009876 [Neoarthrinium moseri]